MILGARAASGQKREFPQIDHRVFLGVSELDALGIGTFLGVSEFRTRHAPRKDGAFSEFPSLRH